MTFPSYTKTKPLRWDLTPRVSDAKIYILSIISCVYSLHIIGEEHLLEGTLLFFFNF